MMSRLRRSVIKLVRCTATVLLVAPTFAAQAEGLDETREFSIDAQALDAALIEFSEQSDLQLMVPTELVAGLQSPGINGEFVSTIALAALLDDNGLTFQAVGDDTVALSKPDGDTQPGKSQPASSQVLMAQNQTSAQQSQTTNSSNTTNEDEELTSIEEIVVTGSHIRGVENDTLPLLVFDRKDIELSGVSNTGEFIQKLPQNFNGGVTSEGFTTINGGSGSGFDTGATGVNLRGLGNDATLTLLNGRRLAPSAIGSAVDVSTIPLAAIERIEILTDGASAIYGSDAVAGVVNIVLRDHYQGAETRLSYGGADSKDDIQFSQIFGTDWQSGNILLTYSYNNQSNLDAVDRKATENVIFTPWDLIAEQEEHTGMINVTQQLAGNAEIYGNLLYSTRDTENETLTVGGATGIQHVNASLGTRISLSESWLADFNILYSDNSRESQFFLGGNPFFNLDEGYEVETYSAKADGPLFDIAGGTVRLAAGAEYRSETLDAFHNFIGRAVHDRDISAVFSEIIVPLISEQNRLPALARFELSFAARYEDYSDFGNTTNPKIGLLMSPTEGFNVRATWGTSFRAPLLHEISQVRNSPGGTIRLMFDPTVGGDVAVLSRTGSLPNLQAEESTNWTFGFDIEPAAMDGFRLSATYFDIDYKDRIAIGVAGSDTRDVLNKENIYAPLITRRSDTGFQELLDLTFPLVSFNPDSALIDDVAAIVDVRKINVGSVRVRGIDFSFDYVTETHVGDFAFQVGGSYLLEHGTQIIETAPTNDLRNIQYSPVDLRLRNSVIWSRDKLSASVFLNYVDSYKDARSSPEVKIDSWITVDSTFRYEFDNDGSTVSLSASNLFDEDPPFVSDSFGLDYDATNASVLGRYISLQVIKVW